MQKGSSLSERDNPKSLLLPGTFPLPVHTLIQRDEGSDSEENLPSTIDLDAIKVLTRLVLLILFGLL
jgi:hypothetical protein